jgi:spermidine synthase
VQLYSISSKLATVLKTGVSEGGTASSAIGHLNVQHVTIREAAKEEIDLFREWSSHSLARGARMARHGHAP